jgi:hypothetical protein
MTKHVDCDTANSEWLDDCFTYHAPGPVQIEQLSKITEIGKAFALAVLQFVPPSADRTVAL